MHVTNVFTLVGCHCRGNGCRGKTGLLNFVEIVLVDLGALLMIQFCRNVGLSMLFSNLNVFQIRIINTFLHNAD